MQSAEFAVQCETLQIMCVFFFFFFSFFFFFFGEWVQVLYCELIYGQACARNERISLDPYHFVRVLTDRDPTTENNPCAKMTQLSVLINGYAVTHPAIYIYIYVSSEC